MNQVGEEEGNFTSERNNCKGGEIYGNLLEDELLHQSKDSEQVFITASLLVVSVFGWENWNEGYCWVNSQIKGTHESLANRIEMEQAVKHLKSKYFDSAINIPKGFKIKESKVRPIVATNLYFMSFIERNLNLAEDYSDIAVNTSRYTSMALVNKGNCFFIKCDFTRPKEKYLEVIGIQVDCVQVIYNLGLENVRLYLPEEAS